MAGKTLRLWQTSSFPILMSGRNRYPQVTRRLGQPSFPSLTIRVGISNHMSITAQETFKTPCKECELHQDPLAHCVPNKRQWPSSHCEPLPPRHQHSSSGTGGRKPLVQRRVQEKNKRPSTTVMGGARLTPF